MNIETHARTQPPEGGIFLPADQIEIIQPPKAIGCLVQIAYEKGRIYDGAEGEHPLRRTDIPQINVPWNDPYKDLQPNYELKVLGSGFRDGRVSITFDGQNVDKHEFIWQVTHTTERGSEVVTLITDKLGTVAVSDFYNRQGVHKEGKPVTNVKAAQAALYGLIMVTSPIWQERQRRGKKFSPLAPRMHTQYPRQLHLSLSEGANPKHVSGPPEQTPRQVKGQLSLFERPKQRSGWEVFDAKAAQAELANNQTWLKQLITELPKIERESDKAQDYLQTITPEQLQAYHRALKVLREGGIDEQIDRAKEYIGRIDSLYERANKYRDVSTAVRHASSDVVRIITARREKSEIILGNQTYRVCRGQNGVFWLASYDPVEQETVAYDYFANGSLYGVRNARFEDYVDLLVGYIQSISEQTAKEGNYYEEHCKC